MACPASIENAGLELLQRFFCEDGVDKTGNIGVMAKDRWCKPWPFVFRLAETQLILLWIPD